MFYTDFPGFRPVFTFRNVIFVRLNQRNDKKLDERDYNYRLSDQQSKKAVRTTATNSWFFNFMLM